jgi:hypothetical protein
MVIAAAVFGIFFVKARTGEHTIEVLGSATHTFNSDVVKWQLIVSRDTPGNDLAQGHAQVRNDIAEVMKQIESLRLEKDAVTIQPLNSSQRYNREGIPTDYHIHQSLYMITDKLSLVEGLALNPERFALKGNVIPYSNLQYFYSKVDSLKISLLGEAMKDARKRAQEIAEGSGVKVGNITSARAGVFQITEPYSTDIAPGGVYNTSSKTKDIRVTVHVTFLLD